MVETFTHDVFPSHTSRAGSLDRTLANLMQADSQRVWLDEAETRPGERTPAIIEEGVEHCRVVVLRGLINELTSDWTKLNTGLRRLAGAPHQMLRAIPPESRTSSSR
jgi:hypothetical protein